MKHCPVCRTPYTEASIVFCTKDGTLLVSGPLTGFDTQPTTLRLPSSNTPTAFASLEDAKLSIREACKDSFGIRIFSNKGLAFFGSDDSVVSLAESGEYKKLRRLRIILMDPKSTWINRGLMALRQYESLNDFKKELRASHDIAEFVMKKFARSLGLHRSGIKYHDVEPYFRMLITDEVAFVSSYAENPTMQVRDLPVFVFQNQTGSLYKAFKRHFNDVWHNNSKEGGYLKETIEAETSAGGILIAGRDDRLFVALAMRDDGSWVLPKGGKEKADEDLKSAAMREVAEEVSLPIEDLRVIKSLDEYTYKESGSAKSRKLIYFFLMQYVKSELPVLRPDPDHSDARWWDLKERLPYMRYSYQKALLAQVLKNEFNIAIVF